MCQNRDLTAEHREHDDRQYCHSGHGSPAREAAGRDAKRGRDGANNDADLAPRALANAHRGGGHGPGVLPDVVERRVAAERFEARDPARGTEPGPLRQNGVAHSGTDAGVSAAAAPSAAAKAAAAGWGAAAKGRGGARSGKGKGGSGRSPSPGILADGTQANGQAGLPLKASRHKYAEQRRRNRINERLDSLRLLVPHTEGSNIAGFLDQVIEYVTKLQHKLNIKPREDVEGEGPAADVSRGVARALVEGKQKADAAAEEENQQVKREASDEGEADRPAKKVKRDS